MKSSPNSTKFVKACIEKRYDEAHTIFEENKNKKDFDVNKTGYNKWTALHMVCRDGELDFVRTLLALPNIEIRPLSKSNQSPFWFACISNRPEKKEIVEELIKKFLTQLSFEDFYNLLKGDKENYKTKLADKLIASEWLINTISFLGNDNRHEFYKVIDENGIDILNLFKEAKVKQIANLFTLTVLHGDKGKDGQDKEAFLKDKEIISNDSNEARRFFGITDKMPIEIQMIIANRILGSGKNFVPSESVNNSLKEILKSFKEEDLPLRKPKEKIKEESESSKSKKQKITERNKDEEKEEPLPITQNPRLGSDHKGKGK